MDFKFFKSQKDAHRFAKQARRQKEHKKKEKRARAQVAQLVAAYLGCQWQGLRAAADDNGAGLCRAEAELAQRQAAALAQTARAQLITRHRVYAQPPAAAACAAARQPTHVAPRRSSVFARRGDGRRRLRRAGASQGAGRPFLGCRGHHGLCKTKNKKRK